MNIRAGVKDTCWTTWALCAGSVLAVVLMGARVGAHPLDDSRSWVMYGQLFGFPFFIISACAWPVRRGGAVMTLLGILAVIASFAAVCLAYGEMNLDLYVLDARAAGNKTASCGPPPVVLFLPVGFAISVVAAVLGLVSMLLRSTDREFLPDPHEGERARVSALELSLEGERGVGQDGITSAGQDGQADQRIVVRDGIVEGKRR